MFKEKIPYDYKEPVTVSVRFTFNLKQFPSAAFLSKRRFAFADRSDGESGPSGAGDTEFDGKSVLPFGVSLDPVRELVLYCTWPEVAENVVMDSSTYTDFDALLAPLWSFRLHYEAIPICFMAECIHELLHQCESMKPVSDIIGMDYVYSANVDYPSNDDVNPLERLTESKISKMLTAALSSTATAATSKSAKTTKKAKGIEGPLKEEQLMAMLYYLFPDAQQESQHYYRIPTVDTVSGALRCELIHNLEFLLSICLRHFQFDPLRIKSAFNDSLVHRFSTLLALCVTYLGGVRAIAQLWAEFTQEMRYRVERGIQIPG